MMMIANADVTQCSLVDKFKRIVGTCCLHLQGRNMKAAVFDDRATAVRFSVGANDFVLSRASRPVLRPVQGLV